jgi:hypothetical protein
VPVWKLERPPLESGPSGYAQFESTFAERFWPALRDLLKSVRDPLDSASTAAIAGPIRFSLDAKRGWGMLLPHLPSVKEFARIFSARALLELHDGRNDYAWTNLLAATRLVTAWTPAPTEVSMLVHFACTTIALTLRGRHCRLAPGPKNASLACNTSGNRWIFSKDSPKPWRLIAPDQPQPALMSGGSQSVQGQH